MGGHGSGERYRWRAKKTTGNQHKIDIRWLNKQGCLRPGTRGSFSCSRGNKQGAYISYKTEVDRIVLNYPHQPKNGDWESVEQVISFDRTPCNYGGHQIWFLCPLCTKRVAAIYGVEKYFLCRLCYKLTYASQQEGKDGRMRRKARKIRARLGASNNLMESILFKPRNMHQKTFDRLRREADYASYLSVLIMGQRLGMNL
jgi:hypothetical protein